MRYTLGLGVTKEMIDDCIVFLHESGDAATVNYMGSRIIELLLSADEEEVFEQIKETYTGFPENWNSEIHTFIDQLVAKGLIVKQYEC